MIVQYLLMDIYLHHRSNGGKHFFEQIFERMRSIPLYDGAEFYDVEFNKSFVFLFEPFTKRWMVRVGDREPMDMIEFTSFKKRIMCQDASAILYSSMFEGNIIEISRKNVNLNSFFYFSISDMIYMAYLDQRLRDELNSSSSEKLEEEKKESLNTLDEAHDFNQNEYLTTPEDVLHFYFKAEKKSENSVFYTASSLIDFIRILHPGFWKLNEEETGKLLNSEGFSICKGRNNRKVRGYFLRLRSGLNSETRMELKVAS